MKYFFTRKKKENNVPTWMNTMSHLCDEYDDGQNQNRPHASDSLTQCWLILNLFDFSTHNLLTKVFNYEIDWCDH